MKTEKTIRLGIEFETVESGWMKATDDRFWERTNYERVWLHGNHCPKDTPHPQKTLVSAGGWVGVFELMASKIYDKVYSLEPNPISFDEFQMNIHLNGYTNIQLDNLALFDGSVETLTMHNGGAPDGCGATSMFREGREDIVVPCTTLRKYFEKNDIQKYAFLMLDVEGAECVLFDDTEFFETYRPIVLVEIHFMYNKVGRMLQSLEKLKHVYNFPDFEGYDKPGRLDTRHEMFIPTII